MWYSVEYYVVFCRILCGIMLNSTTYVEYYVVFSGILCGITSITFAVVFILDTLTLLCIFLLHELKFSSSLLYFFVLCLTFFLKIYLLVYFVICYSFVMFTLIKYDSIL